MSDYSVRDTCRLCGDTRLEELLRFGSTPLANEYPKVRGDKQGAEQDRFPLYLVGCVGGGHVQLTVVVNPERLFPPDYPYQSGTSPVFRKHLEELAEVIAAMHQGPAMVLDVASNDGTFVRTLREKGSIATGVDPAATPAAEWPSFTDFFTQRWARRHQKARHEATLPPYGIVTALNVFAHVDDLDDFTAGVADVLERDGIFIFEVGYLPDVVKRGLFTTVYHEHVSYHHLTPLVGFFQKHGMWLYDAHRIDSQGGSIRGFVRNCGAHQTQSKRLQELLDEETHPSREGLWHGVSNLKEHAKNLGRQLSNFVKQCEGRVCGYGAPAKLTTLLAGTGLYQSSIEYVLDDNPLKVGRFVPGTGVAIVASSELMERQPQGVMLFSSNFADEIQKRHEAYKGRWMVA